MENIFHFQEDSIRLLTRLVVNIIVLFILLHYIYFPYNGKRKFYFTYFLIGIMIFIISSYLGLVNIQMGFALGLFAIFSIIRYRTPPVEIKDMTYLFLVIGVAIVNALVEFKLFWRGIIISNLIILLSTYLLEKYKPQKKVIRKPFVYSPFDFSVVHDNDKLKKEIETLLNMPIIKVTVEKINIIKNELAVTIYYRVNESGDKQNSVNSKILYNK